MAQFQGKSVLVTGGTSGIGYAAATLFKQEGAHVAITGADEGRIAEAAKALDVIGIQADGRTVAATKHGVEEAARRLDGLDVIFLNAGIAKFAPLEGIEEAFFDEQFAVNVKSVLFAAQAAAALMRDGGSIVVNTSVNNRMGMPGTLVYGATKAAARSMVRTLAGELAPRRIRVNAISPGPVETPIYGKLGLPQEQIKAIAGSLTERIALKRFGAPEEIARAALFLASDAAGFITGTELVADGGWTDVMA